MTKWKESDIIDKRSQKGARLKLDNWTTEDRSTKQKSKCEYKICQNQREHNSKKVKKARINSSDKNLTATAEDIQFVWEFDPGSGWTLAACITHSSRTVTGLRPLISGGRVSNAWATCPCVGDNIWKRMIIPHNATESHVSVAKDLLRKDGLALD